MNYVQFYNISSDQNGIDTNTPLPLLIEGI